MFPLEDEAYLCQGFKLTIDNQWNVKSTKITPMPAKQLRPTLVQWGDKILAMAGDKNRYSLVYDTKEDNWWWLPRVPVGHMISCNVCVNYNDLAVFTFFLDGEFTLKSAVMPLQNLQMAGSAESLEKSELEWALEVRKDQHQIDRFHIKQACVH